MYVKDVNCLMLSHMFVISTETFTLMDYLYVTAKVINEMSYYTQCLHGEQCMEYCIGYC